MGSDYQTRKDIDRLIRFLDSLEYELTQKYNVSDLPSLMARFYDTSKIDTKEQAIYGEIDIINERITSILERINTLWEEIYPIGTVYLTTDSEFDPSTSFGGNWELIENLLTGIYAWERLDANQ